MVVACLVAAVGPLAGSGHPAGALIEPAQTVAPTDTTPVVPNFDHIVVITMENKSYSDIIGNSQAPYLNSLAQQYGVASQYLAIRHPSLPNYLALTGGDTFGVATDCNTCYQTQPNLAVDRIEPSGRTWKAYMESMPSACTLGDTGQYIQHHNPFVYYDDIRTNPSECSNDVPYTQLATDFASTATTPNYAWISPNICDDMHNCSIATGDTWLQQNVSAILATPAFTTQNSLLMITFDEDDDSGNNQVPTFLVGPSVTPGLHSNVAYTHYSLLKTIETAWGLAPLTANDAAAAPMSDFFAPISTLASDGFGRTVVNGWGNADVGGPWSISGTPSAFAVNGT
ncbi:MAG TPA: alkaline phosphatase family protein, partial [Acidimicrobiia bacterium]